MSVQAVIDWVNANEKNLWWRHAIRLTLKTGILSENDMNVLYSLAKMEVGLTDRNEDFLNYTASVEMTGFEVEKESVRIKNIGNIQNVSTLVNDQTLNFSDTGLTAVYGDNGSGKSSYAKILKNICLTRGNTPDLISNIYNQKTGIPSASLTIQTNSTTETLIDWSYNEKPNENLKSIRVFDSHSADHYISREDTIEYKPAGLKLLNELVRACESIREKSQHEQTLINTPKILPVCKDATQAKEFLLQLNPTTTKNELEAICLSKEDLDSIEVLQKELIILQTNTPEKLKEKFKLQYKSLQPLRTYFENLRQKLSDQALINLATLYENFQAKLQTAELARKQALEGHVIDGICSQPWQLMWQHVEEFIKYNGQGNSFPPAQGEHCPTCLQVITEDTAQKLTTFNEYLQDKTQIEATNAKNLFEQNLKPFQALSFDLAPYQAVLDSIKSYNPDIEKKLIIINSIFEKIAKNTQLKPYIFTSIPIDFSASDWLIKQISSLKNKEIEIKDNASLKLKVERSESTILELKEREKLSSNKQNILEEIERIKKILNFQKINDSCSYGSVTTLVTSISKKGSIGQLKTAFKQELKELNFIDFSVETDTRGSKGEQLLKIQLSGKKNKIADIASEGEQKCIALAGFLAELTIDERKSTIVFDDPITSLDHKWKRKFADRIAKESSIRQVIVLTHDLSFLKMLEESISQTTSTINIVAIRKHGSLSGYPVESAPWEALSTNNRIKKLNIDLQTLNSLSKEPDPEPYLNSARNFYGKKRETWERLVEEWLLKGVVERFSRDVKTQNIRYLANQITDNDVETINAAMTKCSTYIQGHDRASELGRDFPDYAEIESDLVQLKAYFMNLKDRRK